MPVWPGRTAEALQIPSAHHQGPPTSRQSHCLSEVAMGVLLSLLPLLPSLCPAFGIVTGAFHCVPKARQGMYLVRWYVEKCSKP